MQSGNVREHTLEHMDRAVLARGRDRAAAARAWLRARELRLPAVVFAAHWLIVAAVAALASRYALALPEVTTAGYRLPPLDGWERSIVQPLRNWDGFWYGLIAEQGYGYHPATSAFWPLYPWAMSFLSHLLAISVESAGLLISNAAFFVALVVLRDLVRAEAGDAVARRTLWLLAFFPTAFYFSAVYTESLFLLFSVLCFWWARGERWARAGLVGILAALTRNAGGLLALPLLMMVILRHGVYPRRWPRAAFAVFLPPLGTIAFMGYLWLVWGNPFLTFDIQANWARAAAPPWRTFAMAWDQVRIDWLRMLVEAPSWATLTSFEFRWSFAEYEFLDVAVTLLIVPLLVWCFARLPLAWGMWCAIVTAIPLFGPSEVHPLMSMPRYVLVLFPLFVALAQVLRQRAAFGAALTLSTLLLCGLTVQFVTWFWVA